MLREWYNELKFCSCIHSNIIWICPQISDGETVDKDIVVGTIHEIQGENGRSLEEDVFTTIEGARERYFSGQSCPSCHRHFGKVWHKTS